MYTLEEMSAWTPDEVLVKIREHLPEGWKLDYGMSPEDHWIHASVLDGEGAQKWADGHGDPKILFMDLLGWLMLRGQKAKHPVWKRRTSEVNPNKRPPPQPRSGAEAETGPEDLDPASVAEVWKKHEE